MTQFNWGHNSNSTREYTGKYEVGYNPGDQAENNQLTKGAKDEITTVRIPGEWRLSTIRQYPLESL